MNEKTLEAQGDQELDSADTADNKPIEGRSFTFGDPEPVLDGHGYLQLFETVPIGNYYEPAVSPKHIYKVLTSNPHHQSALQVKRNILSSLFVPHAKLSYEDFKTGCFDYLVNGNCYLQRIENVFGDLLYLKPSLHMHTRRMKEPNQYKLLRPIGEDFEYGEGKIIHLKTIDLAQEIYGLPDYMSAVQSALLNESATLFRRKYFLNGSHAGYILYVNDPLYSQMEVDALETALQNSKGPGNFKNMMIYAPGGKADGVKIMPIAEVAAKDEFANIKEISAADVLTIHRVPPHMMGQIPKNAGGFGDAPKAAQVFYKNEIVDLQKTFLALNSILGEEIVRFETYEIEGAM